MNWNMVFGAQAALAAVTMYAGTLWPATGGSAVLVPIWNGTVNQPWHWISKENAALLSIDNGNVTVRVPSQASLLRAVGLGYLPVSAQGVGCLSPQAAKERSKVPA